jgi:hypothetical protein
LEKNIQDYESFSSILSRDKRADASVDVNNLGLYFYLFLYNLLTLLYISEKPLVDNESEDAVPNPFTGANKNMLIIQVIA